MTYPKLLDYVTKEELIKEFESIFLIFKDFQSKPSEDIVISPIINFEGFQFVRIFYDQEALFTFYNNDDLDDALGNFKNGFGNNNVKVFSEKQSISVNIESSIVAVLEENSSIWKYIEWKEDLFDNIDIIPITVLEKLK